MKHPPIEYHVTPNVHQAIKHAEALVRSQGGKTLTPEALFAGILQTRGVGYYALTHIADPGPDSAERPERYLRREFGGGAAAKRASAAKVAKNAPPLPRAPITKRIIRAATDEARKLGYNYIGTEHLILGLLKQGPKALRERLTAARVTLARYKREMIDLTTAVIDFPIDFRTPDA